MSGRSRGRIWSMLSAMLFFAVPRDAYSAATKYPATLLAIGALLGIRSPGALLLVAAAILWDTSIDILLGMRAISLGRKELMRVFADLRGCRYEELSTEGVLSHYQLTTMKENSAYERLGDQAGLWNHSNSCRVLKVLDAPLGALPLGGVHKAPPLRAYHLPFLKSYIFIRDLPHDPVASFKFNHELGHSLGIQFTRGLLFSKAVIPPLIVVVIGAMFASGGQYSLLAKIASACSLGLLWASLWHESATRVFVNEIEADRHAVNLMTESDREVFSDPDLYLNIVGRDPGMTEKQHQLRLHLLKSALDGESCNDLRVEGLHALASTRALMGWLLFASTVFLGTQLSYIVCGFSAHVAMVAVAVLTCGVIWWAWDYCESLSYEFVVLEKMNWNGQRFAFPSRKRRGVGAALACLIEWSLNRYVAGSRRSQEGDLG